MSSYQSTWQVSWGALTIFKFGGRTDLTLYPLSAPLPQVYHHQDMYQAEEETEKCWSMYIHCKSIRKIEAVCNEKDKCVSQAERPHLLPTNIAIILGMSALIQ